MTAALSNDLRERVVAAIDGGSSRRVAAARFGVCSIVMIIRAKKDSPRFYAFIYFNKYR